MSTEEVTEGLEAAGDELIPLIVAALREAPGFASSPDERVTSAAAMLLRLIVRCVSETRILTPSEIGLVIGPPLRGDTSDHVQTHAWWEAVRVVWNRGLTILWSTQDSPSTFEDFFNSLMLSISNQLFLATLSRRIVTARPGTSGAAPLAEATPVNPEARQLVRRFKVNTNGMHGVAAVTSKDGQLDDIANAIRRWSQHNGRVEVVGDEIVCMFGLSNSEEFQRVITGLTAAITDMDAFAGLSRPLRADDDPGAGYAQARRALAVATLLGTRPVLTFEASLPYELLLRDPDVLHDLNDSLIAMLVEYDHANGASLVQTLRALIGASGSPVRAAEILHVHRHTVTDRLSRIEQVTGKRLSDPDDMRILDLALRASELLRATTPFHDV